MFRIPFLRNIFLLTAAIAIGLPLCESWFVHPAYERTVTGESERQAVRYVGDLVRRLGLDSRVMTRAALSEVTRARLEGVGGDLGLVKLRIFSERGEIIFSTRTDEVGQVNDKPYFRDHVRAGRVYSRVVRRDGLTAERQAVEGDVVETYVPIMVDGAFGGAVETYYDVSGLQKIEQIADRSSMLMWGISLSLLLAMTLVLRRTRNSIDRRQVAEQALQEANQTLEARVTERTAQLEEANRRLKIEMTESRQVREKVDGILRTVADGLLVLDAGQRIVMMNEAAERLLRLRPEMAVGQRLGALDCGAPLVGQLHDTLHQVGESDEAEIEITDPDDDTERHIRLRIWAPAAGGGSEGQCVLLLQDVTSERRVDAMKREFLAMIAHELRSPLSTVIGYTELLAERTHESLGEKKKAEFATHVHRMALNLARIVDDLLDIGRIETGHRLSLCKTDFPLDELLRHLARKYEGALRGGHRFSLDLPDEKVIIHGDPHRLEQVLENLLSNAVKYSPEGGEIGIALQSEDAGCRVTICDQGIGMSAEEAERVFDKFYRTDNASAAAPGNGLGMCVAKHIVESHGGDIWLTSRPGCGTQVGFSLPRQTRQQSPALPADSL